MHQLLRRWTYLLCLGLLLHMMTGATPVWAQAGGDKLDAVLVVDVSNSMSTSDKNKVSNEAMKMFVDMTSVNGNKIGVVSYTDKIEREKALITVNSEQDKQEIKAFIDSLQKGAYTDIAVGVKEAVTILDSGRDPSHYPIIVLLADGNNYLNQSSSRTQQQSDRDLQDAIAKAQAKGFPIYTIGLNADGKLNRSILQKIATDTNGKFFETSTADKLPAILSEIFADHLKLKVVPVQSLTSNGQFQDVPISIPNGNVWEANISIMSGQPVELKLFSPDGKQINIPSDQALLSRSRAYSMLKLIQPEQGEWKLQVKGAPKDKIDINLVFNYDLQLELEPIPMTAFSPGDRLDIKAALTQNGQKVSNPDLYRSMKANLLVHDLTANQTSEVSLANAGSGFEGTFEIPKAHRYEIKVKAEGSSFFRETKPVEIDASKGATAPTQPPSGTPTPAADEKPFPWLTVIGSVLGLLVAGAILGYAWMAWRKANQGFIGQVAIEICNEDTGEKSSPQYKKLNTFKGKVKLHQLLQLAPEFQETEKILFVPGKNDTLILQNRSGCIIEKAGRVVDASKGRELKKNDRIKISLQGVNKSIFLDYIV